MDILAHFISLALYVAAAVMTFISGMAFEREDGDVSKMTGLSALALFATAGALQIIAAVLS